MSSVRPRRAHIPTLVGIAIVLLTCALKWWGGGPLQRLEQRMEWLAFDQRLNLALEPEPAPDPRIVIVDIDEKSLRSEGHWPWSRNKLAELVDRLFAQGAAVVGFDVVFAEAEPNTATQILTDLGSGPDALAPGLAGALHRLAPRLDRDRRFANSLGGGPSVLGYAFTNRSEPPVGVLPAALDVDLPASEASAITEMRAYTANLPVLQQAARRGGFFSAEPDADGVMRRMPLVVRFGDMLYPSLALEVARAYLGMEDVALRTATVQGQEMVEAVVLGGMLELPTDRAGRVIVPYRGPAGAYPYVSATDVLHDAAPDELLRDAIVLVGTTAEGLYDLRSTPVESVYPGVEINANVIAGILDGVFPYRPDWADGLDLLLLLVLGAVLALAFPRLHPLTLTVLTFLLLAGYAGANFWAWSQHGLVLSLATPLAMVFVLATVNLTMGFTLEAHGRRKLKNIFGQYVPPQLVEEMNRDPGADFGFEGESREMTVLFCDIRSFTTISESLPANELKQMLNYFFTPMTGIIFEHRGTIDKYVGDMIMAFWGAPLPDPQHRAHAVAAALAMLERVAAMKSELAARGWPEINIGIGLNSGAMNVGDMGSQFRRAYTVIGDAVNLGSRLEGLTKFYGVHLIVSETTCAGQDEFLFRQLDRVRVKGKAQAIAIFEPVCRRAQAGADVLEELAAHERALARYMARDWDGAQAAFGELHARHPRTKIYGLYLERIGTLRGADPGPDWDGAYTHTSK